MINWSPGAQHRCSSRAAYGVEHSRPRYGFTWTPTSQYPRRQWDKLVRVDWLISAPCQYWFAHQAPAWQRVCRGSPTDRPHIQLLPPNRRALRQQAETFRLVLQHLEPFSKQHLTPRYKKTGARSMAALGFDNTIEAGFTTRPILPNAGKTMTVLTQF